MRNYSMVFRNEFADNTTAAFWGNTGASTAAYSASPDHMLVTTYTTGAATNGWGYFSLRSGSVVLDDANPMVLTYDWMVTTMPTSGEYYILEMGLGTAAAATGIDLSDTDCAMFRWALDENSGRGRFRACAGGAGNSVFTDETTITFTSNVWYRITLLLGRTRAYMLVNDVIVGPITSGLPTTTPMFVVGRISKGTGTTPRLVTMDYFKSARVATR